MAKRRTQADRNQELVHTLEQRISSLFDECREKHYTHDWLLAQRQTRVFEHPNYHKLTQTDKAYLRGVFAGLMSAIWRHDLVWRLGPSTGPTRDAHTEWTEEMSVLCRQPGQLYGGHFWAGSDDVFTEYKATN